jgi:hypothetical protein
MPRFSFRPALFAIILIAAASCRPSKSLTVVLA